MRRRLGISRNVLIQPSFYGTDNRCTLDAVELLGRDHSRAVVVIDERVDDAQLQQMHAQGARGEAVANT